MESTAKPLDRRSEKKSFFDLRVEGLFDLRVEELELGRFCFFGVG